MEVDIEKELSDECAVDEQENRIKDQKAGNHIRLALCLLFQSLERRITKRQMTDFLRDVKAMTKDKE